MKRLLITGGSGFLGWHCSKLEMKTWSTVAAYYQNKNNVFPKTDSYQIDLTDQNSIWKALKEVKPSAVFQLAAESSTNNCEKNPESSYPLNVSANAWLAEMCADLKIRLLFTSSEQVFDGEKGNYSEQDIPNPKNEYGKQKLEAENIIKTIYPEAVIVRIAVLFGNTGTKAKSFFNQWMETWQEGKTVTAFYDEIRPFLSGDDCAKALYHLLKQDAFGLFHLGGVDAMSRYDFGKMMKEIFNLPEAKLISKSQKEIKTAAFRPADLSLNCHKIISTGYAPKKVRDELLKLK